MKHNEIRFGQIYKSNYTDIYYVVFGGSENSIEAYDLENIWNCINIQKEDIKKHFTLIKETITNKI